MDRGRVGDGRAAPGHSAHRLTGLARVAFVLKGYPRLSETFIAQEIAALESRGLEILIVSLRHPTDRRTHPLHAEIRAKVLYLPEYLLLEPLRVLRAWLRVRRTTAYSAARSEWLWDHFRVASH